MLLRSAVDVRSRLSTHASFRFTKRASYQARTPAVLAYINRGVRPHSRGGVKTPDSISQFDRRLQPRSRRSSSSDAIPVNRDGRAADHLSVLTTQEKDDSGDVRRFRPLCEVGIGHGLSVEFRIDDAGKHGIHTYTCTF